MKSSQQNPKSPKIPVSSKPTTPPASIDVRAMNYLGLVARVKTPEEEADDAVRRIYKEIDE